MRSNGVEERFITGDATDREKFQKWAETLEMANGLTFEEAQRKYRNYEDLPERLR